MNDLSENHKNKHCASHPGINQLGEVVVSTLLHRFLPVLALHLYTVTGLDDGCANYVAVDPNG